MNDLKRDFDQDILRWREYGKHALLVDGAPYVGKTHSIRKYIKEYCELVAEIDFAESKQYVDAFARIKDSEDFLRRLSFAAGKKLVPHKSLVFLDSIERVYQRRNELMNADPSFRSYDIISAMKPMVNDGRYRFILSGSFLDIVAKNIVLYPVGSLFSMKMYPLTFFEYLRIRGSGEDIIDMMRGCFNEKKEIDPFIHSFLLTRFREYMMVGGMPEAVDCLLSTQNFELVRLKHKEIMRAGEKGISSYIEGEDKKDRLRKIYKAIPSELDKKNKRFIASHAIEKNYLNRHSLTEDYLRLGQTKLILHALNIEEPAFPLIHGVDDRAAKLFMNDVGLLTSSLWKSGAREKLLDGEKIINHGALYENAVAQELNAHGFDFTLYYHHSKKDGGIDFLISGNGEMLPIQVKAGKPDEENYCNRAFLNKFISQYGVGEAYVFGEGNVRRLTDVITEFPIYMVGFLGDKQ